MRMQSGVMRMLIWVVRQEYAKGNLILIESLTGVFLGFVCEQRIVMT